MLSKALLFIVLCLITPACGFQPLYGSKGSENIIADFSKIHVSSIKDRTGQLLTNELKHLLNPLREPVNPKYQLVTTVSVSFRSLAVKKTAHATRSNLFATSAHHLINTTTRELVSSGSNTSTVSYNIYSSSYATLSAEKDAQKRAVKKLAQDIRLQLGAYFKSKNRLNTVQ